MKRVSIAKGEGSRPGRAAVAGNVTGKRSAGALSTFRGRSVSGGRARGKALVSGTPISFYGGVDVRTGVVIERGHELEGQCVKDRILVFPRGRGSTVGSYVIYGLSRNGAAPGALVNEETETVVATGAILAGIPCIDGIDLKGIKTGDVLEVDADRGTVRFLSGATARVRSESPGSAARRPKSRR